MKKVLILSGIPGCGKSTFASEQYPDAIVCSADDYFVDDETGEYNFDPSKIAIAHSECMSLFLGSLASLSNHSGTVIVDNTNLQAWEWQNYASMARMMGWEVELHCWAVETLRDVRKCARRNTHGVPIEVITRMALNHSFEWAFTPGVVMHDVA